MEEDLSLEGKSNKKRNFFEQTGLQKKRSDTVSQATSRWCYIKHVGYNNIEILDGTEKKGPVAWKVDVKARLAGWAITLRDPEGNPVLHLKKDITFARLLGWDKGSVVNVAAAEGEKDMSGKSESGSNASDKRKKFLKRYQSTKKSLATREVVQGEPKQGEVIVPEAPDKEYDVLDEQELAELPAMAVTTITRKHAFRSNENVFTYNGREYAWNYWVFLGSTLHLTDIESKEELAVVQLLPTWRWQIISSWSWRLDGTLEIKDEGRRRGMEDIIVATLVAMLEWRKHNNKVWIVAAAIA